MTISYGSISHCFDILVTTCTNCRFKECFIPVRINDVGGTLRILYPVIYFRPLSCAVNFENY